MKQTLAHWLTYLESLSVGRSEEGFNRVKEVAIRLRLLPYPISSVVVAGTNGKGSCVTLITSLLRAANYQVGTYTSPHLLHYSERIQINNQPVDENKICAAFTEIELARQDLPLNYFQFSTLAALLLFKAAKVDIAVLEVGIGGRLDAVNIVDADIVAISNIDLDHCELLGSTREEIALEKAGVMRSKKPCIYGDTDMPHTFRQEAKKQQVQLFEQGKDFFYEDAATGWDWQGMGKSYKNLSRPEFLLQNVSTAIAAVTALSIKSLDAKIIEKGLKNAYLPARSEVLQYEQINYLFDVAHNPQATRQLQSKLQSLKVTGKKIAVVGMLRHKDLINSLKPLTTSIDIWHTLTLPDKRAASATQLAEILVDLQAVNVSSIENSEDTWRIIKNQSRPGDLVVIFGSFQTVALFYRTVASLLKR